ncbi:MAG TPA: hypothetical protein VI258_15355, partial [Rhodanobacteraceae bacterium]
ERAADRHAGAGGASTRCALASALVKVARLIPPHPGTSEPISTLIGGGDVAARVQRLLDDAQVVERGVPQAALLALGTAAAAVAIAYAPLLQAVHQVTEVLVNALP